MNYQQAYSILGVSKNSSSDDMKKAYRKMAMKYHPDRNKEPGAEDKFKQAKEAYEFLTTKQEPEQPNIEDILKGFNFGGSGFGNDFHNHFQNRHHQFSCNLSFNDGVSGCVSSLSFPNGIKSSVKIPAGCEHGSVLNTSVNLPTGEVVQLIINININLPDGFKFRENKKDIETELDVDVFDILLGGWSEVKTPHGVDNQIRIPENFNISNKLRIKGAGYVLKNIKGNRFETGDLYITLKPVIPETTKEQRDAFKSILGRT